MIDAFNSQGVPNPVLVVDDEAAIRTLLADVLEEEGYEVTAVTDGAYAVEAATEHVPAAVFLDLDMPIMDGRRCFRALRDHGVTAPIVILSAHGARDAARELGADASVDKPFDPIDVLAKLHALGA